MSSETRACQNCKNQFTIEPDDFAFYERIKVPPPTWCPKCRFQRRTMFRNERVLYKRTCGLCGKNIVSTIAPDKPYVVYCNSCWWSDKWDGDVYAQEYDPSRNFFEQFKSLIGRVPFPALVIDYPTLVNTEYANHVGHSKNSYWIFDSDFCENVSYATIAVKVKDSMDMNFVGSAELCYEAVNCGDCSRVFFSEDVVESHEIYFSKDLHGCSNCFGCVNLRGKNYCVWNEQKTREEYEAIVGAMRLDSFVEIEKLKARTKKFWLTAPHKFIHGRHNVNVSGDYVYRSKNAHAVYQVGDAENVKFCQRLSVASTKDAYDYTEWGYNAELVYECITVGEGVSNVRFSSFSFKNSHDVDYSMGIATSSDLFGCAGMRNKKYCILNKQYSAEEYTELRKRIIADMSANPYVDARGRVWKYGEFFPYDLSLFNYNESTAVQYYPLDKAQVEAAGWRWRETNPTEYQITTSASGLPVSIHEATDAVLKEIIECAECKKAFRIISAELALLRKFGFPLPRKCPECRHMDRMRRLNPPKLWSRKCAKCGAVIETAYSPERPETIYCEQCYSAEVA